MYTKEEWELTDGFQLDELYFIYVMSKDTHIARVDNKDKKVAEANAKRIVDCVNGCEGINPKAVKGLYEALASWDKLRNMRPLDSGDDIDAILEECSEISDMALAEAEKKERVI